MLHIYLGMRLEAVGKREEAVKSLIQGIELDPKYVVNTRIRPAKAGSRLVVAGKSSAHAGRRRRNVPGWKLV